MQNISKNNLKASLRIIQKYLHPYYRQLIILSGIGIGAAFANALVPFILGNLFDAIIKPDIAAISGYIIPLLPIYLCAWVIAQITASMLDWSISEKSRTIGINLFTDYMVKSYGTLLEMPLSFHKAHKIGEITNKISKTANALETTAINILGTLASQFLSIIVALIVALLISPSLALVLIVGIGIYCFMMARTVPATITLDEKVHDAYDKAFGDAYDAVANVAAVKQVTAEEYEKDKMNRLFRDQAAKYWLAMSSIWNNLGLYQRLTILITQLLIIAVSIIRVQNGSMTVGELVMFNGYAVMLFSPFVTLGRQWQTIQNGLVSLTKSEQLLNTPRENYSPKNSIGLTELEGNIVMKDVDFYYEKDKPVLKNISFEAKPGEVIALVGQSGVGKSTFVDLISGYHFPKKGSLTVDDHKIERINLKSLRSFIAVVPQEVVLFNDTIKTNISYGNLTATMEEIKRAALMAEAHEFIERFPKKWNQLVGERGVKLSVGQKQRVAIARAILRNPRILILDEPTSALDAKSEHSIQQSLEKLMEGKTTFIIAHRLSTVRKADKILVFENGEIVEQGTHQELYAIEGGRYRELYELQIGLHA